MPPPNSSLFPHDTPSDNAEERPSFAEREAVSPPQFKKKSKEWEQYLKNNTHLLPITTDEYVIPTLSLFATRISLSRPNNLPQQEQISIIQKSIHQYERIPQIITRAKNTHAFGSSSARIARIPAAVIASDDQRYAEFLKMNTVQQKQLLQDIATLTPDALNAIMATDAISQIQFASLIHALGGIYGGMRAHMGESAEFASNKGLATLSSLKQGGNKRKSTLSPSEKQTHISQYKEEKEESEHLPSHPSRRTSSRHSPQKTAFSLPPKKKKSSPIKRVTIGLMTGVGSGVVLGALFS